MSYRDRAEPDHMREAEARVGLLPLAALAAQLAHDLGDLPHSRRPQRVAHADQPTGGVDSAATADGGIAIEQPLGALAGLEQTDRFAVSDFLDGKGVVQLDQIEILRGDARALIGPLRG